MATKRAPIPMRMKVRAGARGSMDYDGSISQGIELAFNYLPPAARAATLAELQAAHAKLSADEGTPGVQGTPPYLPTDLMPSRAELVAGMFHIAYYGDRGDAKALRKRIADVLDALLGPDGVDLPDGGRDGR